MEKSLLEGFKEPSKDIIFISRDGLIKPTYLQMYGRCVRPIKAEKNELSVKYFEIIKTEKYRDIIKRYKESRLAFSLEYWLKFWFLIVFGYLSIALVGTLILLQWK